jgi:hypothetical protein
MKLVLITAVAEYKESVCDLFKEAGIDAYSSSDIDGHKDLPEVLLSSNWFSGGTQAGTDSMLYFSFAQKEKVGKLLEAVRQFNAKKAGHNPLHAAVVPIEEYV